LSQVAKSINVKGKAVLLIGDTHIPYEHPQYLDFCKLVYKSYKCSLAIHMGDELDFHDISFHKSDKELLSASGELDLAIERLKPWHTAFNKLILLESNHGSLITRRAKSDGIPIRVLKPLQELYDVAGWTWWHDVLLKTSLGDVYLCHGKKSTYGGLAKEMGCSAAQGHYHGKSEITWHKTTTQDRFNLFVGCGIDWNSLAFAYGKNNIPKPILSCAVIGADGLPHTLKMKLDSKGYWVGVL
jgi:hypothetical protein